MKNRINYKIGSIFIASIIFFCFQNCNSYNNNENIDSLKNQKGEFKYEWIPDKKDDFQIDYQEYGDRKLYPHLIKYIIEGKIKNNTCNIYKKAKLTLILLFELENGKMLSGDDVNYSKMFGGCNDFTIWSNWKPSEETIISDLHSCSFSTEYIDYPIKRAIIQCRIELVDQINGTNETIINSQNDVTDKWQGIVSKVKKDAKGIHK